MRRREFIIGLGRAATWPLAARAQPGDRVRRIGMLMPLDENDPAAKTWVSAFTQGLADLGWTDGRNVRIDLRWHGDDINRIRPLAQELVGLQPDIIVTGTTPTTVAVQRETRTIPIVSAVVSDPVARGIVARLNQPDGNITGFANLEASLGGKWLELLSEIAPGLRRAAIMFNPDAAPVSAFMPSLETVARSLKVVPIVAPVRGDAEIEMAITALKREPGGGLVVMPDGFTGLHQFDVASRKRTWIIAGDDDRADRRARAHHWHREDATPIAGLREFVMVGWISQRILDLSHRSSQNRAARGLIRLRRSWMRPIESLQDLRGAVVMGHQFHQLTIEREDRTHAPPTEAHRVGNNGVEHGLDIGRRPADHAQYIARCSLLLQRLAQFAAPGLRLKEHIEADGPTVFAHACRMGLEGTWLGGLLDRLPALTAQSDPTASSLDPAMMQPTLLALTHEAIE
jgi:putative tryptophan/tyrosine transport system substrate-binding protein